MIGFHVQVNDEAPIRVGDAAISVLTAIVSYAVSKGEVALSIGGLVAPPASAREHVDWLQRQLEIGDRIVVSVVDAGELDPPVRRTPEDPELSEQQERRYYERLKARFERS